MKKLAIILISLFFPISIEASSASFIVMDADSGRVLAGNNINEKMLIASTTKIMTAVVALENANINSKYTVSSEIKEVYGSMIYIKENEILTLEDLLYGMMLRSGNDASMVIANNIGKNYEYFIYLMNKKAASLNMYNTVFENPHGLDDKTKNYSTPKDMALLMKHAIKNKEFLKITSTKKYKCVTNLNTHIWYNKNNLLSIYKFSTSGKIGYTKKSKHVFVSSASKENKNLIIVTFRDTDQFNNHKNLYEKYFSKYQRYQILDKNTFLINEKRYKNFHLYIKNDFNMLLKKSEIKDLEMEIKLAKNKIIIGETKVGYINIKLNDETIYRENIYAIRNKTKIQKIKSILFFWRK